MARNDPRAISCIVLRGRMSTECFPGAAKCISKKKNIILAHTLGGGRNSRLCTAVFRNSVFIWYYYNKRLSDGRNSRLCTAVFRNSVFWFGTIIISVWAGAKRGHVRTTSLVAPDHSTGSLEPARIVISSTSDPDTLVALRIKVSDDHGATVLQPQLNCTSGLGIGLHSKGGYVVLQLVKSVWSSVICWEWRSDIPS